MPSADPSAWVVHKFGGSSVADAECFRRVAHILETLPPGRLGVVLSACRGVTDALLGLVARAEAQDDAWRGDLDALRARHATIAESVLSAEAARLYMSGFDRDRHDIEGILHTVKLTRSAAQNVRDLIAGYGEIWSTKLFREFFAARAKRPGEVRWIDARDVVVVEWGPLGPAVQWEESRAKLRRLVPVDDAVAFDGTLIITGFIASDRRGVQTTLGRNGSDFSGSIFGSLLDSSEIHIWTDVDGVLSADPRRVPDAKVIDSLSYNEAMELAYFGAKVIHPQTMAPAVGRGIPIWIRNTFAPGKQGSLICARPDSKLPVKGITTIENIAMVNVEGAGMIGVPGTAHRLFGALREEGISVILISQGSSEHSICCAIPGNEADRAARVVAAAFDREVKEGQIQSIQVDRGLAILAVVGDGMAGLPGISGQVFAALGSAGVNVHAIAQGASERNISVVVDGKDATRALRAVHSGFYLSPHTISIGLIGPGAVGRVLLAQIAAERERLLRDFKLDLRVRGLMTSKKMLLSEAGVPLDAWKPALDASTTPADIAKFVEHLHVDHLPHTVILDCTADEGVAKHYADWLKAGIHVVTPNKKANSGPLAYYESLKAARKAGGSSYLYEATVGAGLPVISTLRDLRETGDKLSSVEGIFSGTLAYLFNVYDGKKPFSDIVKDAKAKGYTEPDPRDDLSGTDFTRKVIILGREMGLKIEMQDVQVESLIPPGLEKGTPDDFLANLPKFDGEMKKRFDAAAAMGKGAALHGRLTADGKATCGCGRARSHARLRNIALTDNVVLTPPSATTPIR
jgi:aspartokinase/homoserine dehydrogenase 1